MKSKLLLSILVINAIVPVSFAETKCAHKEKSGLFANTNPKPASSSSSSSSSSGSSVSAAGTR